VNNGVYQKSQKPLQLEPGFAEGYVIHNRLKPKPHRFKYNMCWCVFDLAQMDHWIRKTKFWKHNGWSLFSIKDKDYVNADECPIEEKIKSYITAQTQKQFSGRIYLFTHPRFLGYGFNSVSMYFCYQDKQLSYIISEINNTPWGEKKMYLHDCQTATQDEAGYYLFEFKKSFHISPFVSMNVDYSWRFFVDQQTIKVNMALHQDNVNILNVVLDTNITPYMDNSIIKFPLRRLFQPWKMSLGIYWQAMKLWLKKTPFYSHPESK